MRAMILAAGRGSRLRPLTDTTPKPLIEVGSKSLIAWHIEKLKSYGIDEIVVNSAYLSDKIVSFLGDGSKFNVKIIHSVEGADGLETAGGIINALEYLTDKFFVINADIYVDCDYKDLIEVDFGSENAYLHFVKNPAHNLGGDFSLEGKKVVFGEEYTFSGIALYNKKAFIDLKVQRLALKVLFKQWIEEGKLIGGVLNAPWFDVGTIERLNLVDNYIRNKNELMER